MTPELHAEFLAEASGHLETIEHWLLALGDAEPPADARSALRSAHSLKGAARMVGASELAELAGQIEARIAKVARRETPEQGAIDAVLKVCEEMTNLLERSGPDDRAHTQAADPDVRQRETVLWEEVRRALPALSEVLLESLTEFQCYETLRLLKQGCRFWLVAVHCSTDAFETASDQAVASLRQQGHVIGQSVGVSRRDGFDYSLTILFAGRDEPLLPPSFPFPAASEELPAVLSSQTTREASRPGTDERPQDAAPEGQPEVVDERLQEVFLASADNLVQELTDAIAASEREPDSTEALDALFRAGHSLKGVGGSFGFPIVSCLGREMEQVLDRVRRRQLAFSDELVDVLYGCVDALGEIIVQAREGTLDQNAPLPVVEKLRRLLRGEGPGEQVVLSSARTETTMLGATLGHALHLSVEAADRLVDLGRDAWLAAETASFVAPPEGEVRQATERARSSIISLVDAILATRMQPVGQILRAYPRVVREVCRHQSKRVHLDIVGADVQMDRLLLEAINDPLVHLVRNALDHGIETVEERERAGKPAEGTLGMHVSADRETVTIAIRDDGRGVDLDALKRKAVELGRLKPEEAAHLGEAQALDLMFLPGISTSETVTELSGRGVGMDVVRAKVEQVRGRVEVSTKRGEGTTVCLRLPLTTAVLRVVRVMVAGMPLCVPTAAVERVVSVTPGSNEFELVGSDGRREVIPLVPARRYLAGETTREREQEALILRDHRQALGLLVDRVEEERPVLVTDLGGLIPRTKWVGACTLLASGQVAPILDTNAILGSFAGLEAEIEIAEAPQAAAARSATGPKTILAVDDSPTTLQLMRNVLELAGYRVDLASDGEAALEVLSRNLPDLALIDVAMPGMDGLTLIREIRRRWAKLPVAIVSGRDREADRSAGMEAGADAYIVKGATDRRGLLATVARLLGEGTER